VGCDTVSYVDSNTNGTITTEYFLDGTLVLFEKTGMESVGRW